MRFLPDGPSLPDELLDQCDRGNVVFLCGAGVSIPAGLPNFPNLADQVMEACGTADDAPSRSLLRLIQLRQGGELDRVFTLLEEEYHREDVDAAVQKILRPRRRASLKSHATILRLSRD